MLKDLSQLLNYNEANRNKQENKQSTAYIIPSIYDQLVDDPQFCDKRFNVFSKFQDQEYLIIKDQNILQITKINQQQSNISISFQYFSRKYNLAEIQFFFKVLNKLQQKTNNDNKIYMNKGYLTFIFHVFVRVNNVANLLKEKKKQVNDLIQYFENLISSDLIQSSQPHLTSLVRNIQHLDLSSDIFTSNISLYNNERVKLFQQLIVLDQNEKTKIIKMQILGQRDLLKAQYINSFQTTNAQLNLINNGSLNNLELKVNAIINQFTSQVQQIMVNLFIRFYFESKNCQNFQFLEYQTLKDYFSNSKHKQDSFEIRIHLLIQIYCAYLLKNQLNLDQEFSYSDEVILIDSKKQIKLDMLEYLKYIQQYGTQSNQKINQQDKLLEYSELLIPTQEKQIMIGDYNLSQEIKTMKQLIVKNEIKLNSIIIKLIMIEDLIRQKMKSLFCIQ